MFMDGEVIYAVLLSNHDSDEIEWLCNNDTTTPVTSNGLSATYLFLGKKTPENVKYIMCPSMCASHKQRLAVAIEIRICGYMFLQTSPSM